MRIKNSLKGFNSRTEQPEGRISEPEDKRIDSIRMKNKRMKWTELKKLEGHKHTNICIMEVSGGENRTKK